MKHLRTTNLVESHFAAVRLRTAAAKWYKKAEKATAVIWKTLLIASGLPGGSTRTRLLADVANGVVDANGVGQQAEAPVAAAQVLSPGIPKGVPCWNCSHS